jgi:hypothetical protein
MAGIARMAEMSGLCRAAKKNRFCKQANPTDKSIFLII